MGPPTTEKAAKDFGKVYLILRQSEIVLAEEGVREHDLRLPENQPNIQMLFHSGNYLRWSK